MRIWTDHETGAEITQARSTRETVSLRAAPEPGDLYLDELRELVTRSAHLPGTAVVLCRPDRIDVEYVDHGTAADIEIPGDEDQADPGAAWDRARDRELDERSGVW
ncbi:hypothetical protein [Nocardia terpenica]|uniref:Uncharacterized protein n=1 Tax=Nocardia terpenica TaxID=455432 RepID=A0A164JW61_9NOCA|nr:hypothetical protein [Nocardia terpenica]KZM70781.1 hypothetical protein AWN90_40200 [Nocardia terpenica]NQE89954.1 hypothetical protein [Nocardia terpenica]